MSLLSVFDQYAKHIMRLTNKKPSANRSKGLAYYTAAAESVVMLIGAQTPAWANLTFDKATTHRL